MTQLAEALSQVTDRTRADAEAAGDDIDEILRVLREARGLKLTDDHHRHARNMTHRDLVARALQLGVDQRDLYGLPFSRTTVLDIAEELGLKVSAKGPRPHSSAA